MDSKYIGKYESDGHAGLYAILPGYTPNPDPRTKVLVKMGMSTNLRRRISVWFEQYIPKVVGGFKVLGLVHLSPTIVKSYEKRCFELAAKHNFERVGKSEYFWHLADSNLLRDVQALFQDVRGFTSGNLLVFNPQSASIFRPRHDSVDPGAISAPRTHRTTRLVSSQGGRSYMTAVGGQRILRNLTSKV
jgi:hypothetical protein